MTCAWMRIVLLFALASSVRGYASYMCGVNPSQDIDPTTDFCTVPVQAGQNIPGMGLMSFDSASVRVISVSRGDTVLSSGATYTPGETLTVSFPLGSATLSQGLLDVVPIMDVASMGTFSAGELGLCCGGRRVALTSNTTTTFTVRANAAGSIVFLGAWSNGAGKGITIAPSFVLTQVGTSATSSISFSMS